MVAAEKEELGDIAQKNTECLEVTQQWTLLRSVSNLVWWEPLVLNI